MDNEIKKPEVDPRFDLAAFRTSEQRIEMVLDPDCPAIVLEKVAEFDTDRAVVIHTALGKNATDKISKFIIDRGFAKNKKELKKELTMLQSKYTATSLPGICPTPWNHVSTSSVGTIRMCCQMINVDGNPPKDAQGSEGYYGILFKEDGTRVSVHDDITQHRNNPAWKELRRQMLAGEKPDICKLCYNEEDNGIGSRRNWETNVFPEVVIKAVTHTKPDGSIEDKDFPLEYFDLRFGNKCNLACRSCGPTDSDLWYKDWLQIKEHNFFPAQGVGNVYINDDGTLKNDPFNWTEDNKLLDHIKKNIKGIKRFYFTGGEPTINHSHRELLQHCIDQGVAKNISLDYNTNMAGVPAKIFQQWKEFKALRLGMSIDGIFEHFEYIRYPGKWSAAYKNMRRLDDEDGFENIVAGVSMTLSIMNVLHYLDMQWWMLEQEWNRISPIITIHNLYGPRYMNIQNLPDEAKDYIEVRYKKFISDMKRRWPEKQEATHMITERCNSVLIHMREMPQDEAQYALWFHESEKLDKVRNNSWKTSCPEVFTMLTQADEKKKRGRNVQLARTSKK